MSNSIQGRISEPSLKQSGSLSASWLASQSAAERQMFLGSLSDTEAAALLYDWTFWARPAQLPPPKPWTVWVIKAGRGYGKTRSGAEWIRAEVERGRRHIALVAKTPKDARDVMIEGESGLLAIAPPWDRPHYEPSKARVTWVNGARATIYSAEEPDQLRGPQHDGFWVDEFAKFKFPKATWDNLMLGLRMGEDPCGVVTTTPRPIPSLKAILHDSATVVTSGSTYENAANVAPAFLREILRQYEHTRLGRQELHAELLEDVPGALWTHDRIDALRVSRAPRFRRVSIAIDPAGSSEEDAAETGIVAGAIGEDGHGYVVDDASGHYTPGQWADRAIDLYLAHEADRIVAEINHGGEMVGHTIRTAAQQRGLVVRFVPVTASRGKQTRAEPIAALFEQGRVHLVGGFPDLEDQMCSWLPGMRSPDRMDALVWALTDLMLGESGQSSAEVDALLDAALAQDDAGAPEHF